jgi:hypothetical protein
VGARGRQALAASRWIASRSNLDGLTFATAITRLFSTISLRRRSPACTAPVSFSMIRRHTAAHNRAVFAGTTQGTSRGQCRRSVRPGRRRRRNRAGRCRHKWRRRGGSASRRARSPPAGDGPGWALPRCRARSERIPPPRRRDRTIRGGIVAVGGQRRHVDARGAHPLASPVPLSGKRAGGAAVRRRRRRPLNRGQPRAEDRL